LRSQSENSSPEKSPCREKKSKENNVCNSRTSVSVDNIESYENSVNNNDMLVWVEKTKESFDSNKTSKNYRSHSSDDSDKERVERSNSDSENESHRKKHKKSKKHKRLKES
jgi:hypothetical protein